MSKMEKTLLHRDSNKIKHRCPRIKVNRTDLWRKIKKLKKFLEYLKVNNMKK